MAGTGNANGNNNDNSIIVLFLLSETQNYVFVVVLPSRDNQKFSKLLCKGFERSVYCNEHKTKSDNKNVKKKKKKKKKIFFFFVRVNRLFVLVYANPDAASKRFKAKKNYW